MTIEYNEIHNVCLETGDVGAVYTGRDYTFRGNRINYNFIHDIGGVGMGSMGIYMDDCVSGTEIRGNILKNSTRAVFLGGGRDFKVENNIFINCKPAIQIDGRGIDKNPVWSNMVNKYMRDRLKEMNHHNPPYSTRYPEIATVDKYYEAGNGVPPEDITIKNNICAGGVWLKIEWNAKPECAKVADNTVSAEPGFVDAEKGDFLLKDDAPALKTGFKQIPVSKIGLQKDVYRK
jgi:parallel beta-helix repeat protein